MKRKYFIEYTGNDSWRVKCYVLGFIPCYLNKFGFSLIHDTYINGICSFGTVDAAKQAIQTEIRRKAYYLYQKMSLKRDLTRNKKAIQVPPW